MGVTVYTTRPVSVPVLLNDWTGILPVPVRVLPVTKLSDMEVQLNVVPDTSDDNVTGLNELPLQMVWPGGRMTSGKGFTIMV